MKAKLIILVLILLNTSVLAQGVGGERNKMIVYEEALSLFNQANPSSYTDSLALSKFLQVISIIRADKKNAFILADCYEKAGVLKQTYGFQRQAITFYKNAIACRSVYKLADSLQSKPYLYCGSAYFTLSLFDSAQYYLKQAETILLKFPIQQEVQSLYNSLGALYYESGNYPQSINYFRKAVQLNISNWKINKNSLDYAYKSNIASALRQMGEYNSSVFMYKSLIPLRININEVFINLGTIFLEKNKPDSALYYLSKVAGVEGNNRIILENALGSTYIQKSQLKAASLHLSKALYFFKRDPHQRSVLRKNKYIGVTYKLMADVAYQLNNMSVALPLYQQSIIQLDYSFNDTAVYRNPSATTAGFRNYALFESLAAKANCLAELHKRQPTDRHRETTIDTYQVTLRLADYIEKSFDSEDAQLFTIQKVFPVYQKAVTFLIGSFEQTNDETYLEEAFRLAEKSKAVALHINLKENALKLSANIPDSLLKKERDLKFNLSRLIIKMDKSVTSQQMKMLRTEMQEIELALSRLASKLLDYPEYWRKKFAYDRIDIAYLRSKLLRQNRAIVSYFQTDKVVYCFVLTQDGIHYYTLRRDDAYHMALRTLNAKLRNLTPGLPYRGHADARFLYDQLISPAERELRTVSSLIIIPHNELSLLPFEILEDKKDRYLLEKFDVTYQYAAAFLQDEAVGKVNLEQMLAMAPFDSAEEDSASEFARLPASDSEITDMEGIKLRAGSATKANFLRFSKNASAIHLATHAIPDNEDPSQSYIAFYANRQEESKLYAHELRNAPLSSVNLIFLSACETASGKLISGEGVMSLSRAFSAAGCSNVVTSLWKAEDNATAYISNRFYAYLKQGYSLPKALRNAKIDLLQNGQYAQFHSPQYWSHLVFVGIPDNSTTSIITWIWGSSALLVGVVAILGWRRKNA